MSPRLLVLVLLFAPFTTDAAGEPAPTTSEASQLEVTEFDRSSISSLYPIHSRSDLDSYLADNPDSPVHSLSHGGRQAFLDNLVFTEKGLGSFNYRVLEDELTPTQIYQVLSLFGLGALVSSFDRARIEVAEDESLLNPGASTQHGGDPCPLIYNYYCHPPASCRRLHTSICITCNCGMQTP